MPCKFSRNYGQNNKCSSYRAPPPPRDKQEMRRIRALKKLQLESTNLEAQFYIEVQKLESKYLVLNQPLFEKRRDIISGSHEPTDEEAHWSDDEDNEEEDVLAIKTAGNQGNHS